MHDLVKDRIDEEDGGSNDNCGPRDDARVVHRWPH